MTDYQKYQLQWMIDHGYSLQDLMSELTSFQYDDPEDSDRISTPISELFDEWVADSGFGSEIWACEEEWKDCDDSSDDSRDIVDAEYTSVWDGGVCITTPCKVNLVTREILDIDVSADAADSVETLDEEYVTINGKQYPAVVRDYYSNVSEADADGYYWYE